MIKDIKYNGYTAQPSDYECSDGQLATAINLVPEYGGLKPVMSAVQRCIVPAVYDILLIHKTASGNIYIFTYKDNNSTSDTGNIFFATEDEVYLGQWGSLPHPIASVPMPVVNAAAIGNIVILTTPEGIRYLQWRNGTYRAMTSHPPFIPLSFRLDVDYRNAPRASSSATIHGVYTENGAIGNRPISPEEKNENQNIIENAVIGLFNKLHSEATENRSFDQPFFIRYALRLFDGSYVCHSSPIFLHLNKNVSASVRRQANSSDSSKTDVSFTMTLPRGNLKMKILTGEWTDDIIGWEDIVASLDIFVSAPLYTVRTDKIENASVSGGSLALTSKNGWVNDVLNCASFYKIASIKFQNIKPGADYGIIHLEDTHGLEALTTKFVLPDEFRSMATVLPKTIFPFNNRLHIANYETTLNCALPIESICGVRNFIGLDSDATPIVADVFVSIIALVNGQPHRSVLPDDIIADSNLRSSNNMVFERDGQCFLSLPPFIYVNEPSARWLELVVTYTKPGQSVPSQFILRLPLTTHDFLNGAYWHSLYGISNTGIVDNSPEELMPAEAASLPFAPGSTETTFFDEHNKIKQSPVNNPFYFPPESTTTTGQGRVISISSAAKALSQGQFGQFPLYAFTTEGVWALEINASGDFAARQPITRDVILANTDPLQMDSAVLFATDRGIMLISGSQTQCITDVINSKEPFNVLRLPGMAKLHTMLGHNADTCLPTVPFLEFMAECGMLYDYMHQRVIVYNPHYTYAYIYSLKSKEWGMMYSTIEAGINSYPEALAVDHNGALLDFSSMEGEATKGLFVTRPLKLEMPDVLKTVDTVIQRGYFQKGHVQSVLYGSRDLFNWHLVWSSKDHYLRGFRGTPYKYFRIAGVTSLSDDESIFGASLQFNPRQTNQLR